MKAVVIRRFGGPEVLEVADLPVPEPGPGEVRIRVAAATVNPTDIGLRSGAYGAVPLPAIPGMELAGTVDAVGAGVTTCHAGDRVMAIVQPRRPEGGAQAELVVVPADSVAPIPSGASLTEAATLPMNGLTVRRALDLLQLPAGATLAITGAAGAVGGYAIQLGKVEGLRIVADAAPADVALVRGLGADIVVARGQAVAAAIRAAVPGGVDALLDAAVQGAAVLPAVRDGGQIAAVRRFEGGSERGIRIHQVGVTDYLRNHAALAALGQLAGAGRLTLRVTATFPPEQVGEAHRRLQAGGVRGRMLIVF